MANEEGNRLKTKDILSRKTRMALAAFVVLGALGLYGCTSTPTLVVPVEATGTPISTSTKTATATATSTATPESTSTSTPKPSPTKSVIDLLKPRQNISASVGPKSFGFWTCWQEGRANVTATFTKISIYDKVSGWFSHTDGLRKYKSNTVVTDQVLSFEYQGYGFSGNPKGTWNATLGKPGQQAQCDVSIYNPGNEPVDVQLKISGKALWCDINYIYYRFADDPNAVWQRCLRNPGNPSSVLNLGE